MPCSSTRLRHNCTVGRLTCSCAAIPALSCPARAAKIIRQRSATCCGVPCEASHCFSCVCSAASNLIARLVFGTTWIIAIVSPKSYLRDTTLGACHQDERRQIAGRSQPVGMAIIEERAQLLPL